MQGRTPQTEERQGTEPVAIARPCGSRQHVGAELWAELRSRWGVHLRRYGLIESRSTSSDGVGGGKPPASPGGWSRFLNKERGYVPRQG